MTATRAATVQLAVPAIAALGGVLFLSEIMTARLVVSAWAILGGIGLSVSARGLADKFSVNKLTLGRSDDSVR